jgi:hypothetical protein
MPVLASVGLATQYRHPELGSGSIVHLNPTVEACKWMLKQVQHDVCRRLVEPRGVEPLTSTLPV